MTPHEVAGRAWMRAAEYGGVDFANYYAQLVFDFEYLRVNFRPGVATAYGMWRGLDLLVA